MSLKDGGIIVIDYGGQTAQLIARRVREVGVYAALVPYDTTLEAAREAVPGFTGLIFSGGPLSIYAPDAPQMPAWALDASVPVLGICYGLQAIAHALGGRVSPGPKREFGPATLHTEADDPLFRGVPAQGRVWMSHNDHVEEAPAGFISLARSPGAPFAALGDPARRLYGVQFHPEVSHTEYGAQMLQNFVIDICGAAHNWTPVNFIEDSVSALRAQLGTSTVLLGLSGGVDSAVTAALLARAIGDQLHPVFVNHGMLRQGEPAQVTHTFGAEMGLPLTAVDATEEFLSALQGVTDPEAKRRIIGELFVRTFEKAATQSGAFEWLAQGTIYPDVIESAGTGRPGAKRIKSHHNVGGLPEDMDLQL
ncbi:MAG: glutamine-hydrolyzing GMP synthase, partial [Anaerolineales bacterium]